MTTTSIRTASLLGALALASLAAPTRAASIVVEPATALWGPPVICHPIDIGDARSLPFGEGAFDQDASFDLDTIVGETHALLESSDDTLVHMETLRRAVVYVTGGRHDGTRARKGDIDGLIGTLEKRLDGCRLAAAQAAPGAERTTRRAWGLAAFDLAWTLEGLAEMGQRPRTARQAGVWLQTAVAARPDDGALRLGASIVCFARGEQRSVYVHLEHALAAVSEPSDLLGRNISNTMGSFLGATDHRELAARVASRLKGA